MPKVETAVVQIFIKFCISRLFHIKSLNKFLAHFIPHAGSVNKTKICAKFNV